MEKPVNLSGGGEDQVIKDLLSPSFATLPDTKALDIALALQQLVRGQESILNQVASNNQAVTEELRRMQERMDEYDKASAKWNEDKEKFIQEVVDRAERTIGAADKDKLIAQGVEIHKKALETARAEAINSRLRFEYELAHMPTETIVSPGRLEMVQQGGAQVPKLFSEEVRIRHKVWILKPGEVTVVPKIVADLVRERRLMESETEERREALGKNLRDDQLAKRMNEISSKYSSGQIELPIGST